MLAKAAVTLAVIAYGFTHISDDDYSRVVIAQTFAVAPRLDPSGTSWLPAPFWLAGGAMMIIGRGLFGARIVAMLLGALSPLAALIALRRNGVSRVTTMLALVVAVATPWSAWSSATTVPDGWTAALVMASAFALMSDETIALAAGCAAVAALSRYEGWPLCAVVAARTATVRPFRRGVGPLLVAVAAPVAWMAWNRFAHGDALHFLARVATFRRNLGVADVPLASKLAEYPRALLDEAPEALVFAVIGATGLMAAPAEIRARLRSRWTWPLLAAAAVTIFLVIGDASDGAPTHHPVRPLLGVVGILIVWGGDTLRETARRPLFLGLLAVATLAWDVRAYRAPPGTGDADRSVQLARGAILRQTVGPDDALQATPCAYEHFALLASFAAPERATIAPPRPKSADDEECPRVTVTPLRDPPNEGIK